MGFSAHLSIHNERHKLVRTYITGVQGMFDEREGSELYMLNNMPVERDKPLLGSGGDGVYIEAKAFPYLSFSKFTLEIRDESQNIIDTLLFSDLFASWKVQKSNADVLVFCDNNHQFRGKKNKVFKTAKIVITVLEKAIPIPLDR